MRLVIDIGNSQTKTGVFNDDELVNSFTFKFINIEDMTSLLERYPNIDKCIMSSVAIGFEETSNLLHKKGIKILKLDQNTKLPIKNLYQSKNTLGYDRIAAAAGAFFLFPGSNILVVDAGTAITIDFVNSRGEFLGGNISPGIEMRFKALNQHTQKLPLLSKNENLTRIGHTTGQAILNGVLNGTVFELAGYAEMFSKQFNDFKTVITGGDADFFVKKLKNPIFANPNLVLIGLNRILTENEI